MYSSLIFCGDGETTHVVCVWSTAPGNKSPKKKKRKITKELDHEGETLNCPIVLANLGPW